MDAAKTADMEDGEQMTQRAVHMPPVCGIRTPNISGPSTGESERRSVVSDGHRESHRVPGHGINAASLTRSSRARD